MRIARGTGVRRLTGIPALAVVISASLGPIFAAEPTDERRPGADPELQRQEAEITAAFSAADADRVARLLSTHLKTYVACQALAREDGYYGADQLRFLLRRLFRGRESTGFKVITAVTVRADGQAVLQGIWTYRDVVSPAAQLHLAFTLARESGAWRLREIRDLS